MTSAYLDTSALLPLLDADDRDHTRAVAALARLATEGARLVTTSYTLVETGALVRSRLGIAAFRALGKVIDRAAEVVWVDEDMHRRAWAEAASSGKRGPSLVDWVAFLVIEEQRLDLALALDDRFGKRGIATLP